MRAGRRHRSLLGTPPTEAERVALIAIAQPGAKETTAARSLGVTPEALHGRLRRLYARLGVSSAAQAVWLLHVVPDARTVPVGAPEGPGSDDSRGVPI